MDDERIARAARLMSESADSFGRSATYIDDTMAREHLRRLEWIERFEVAVERMEKAADKIAKATPVERSLFEQVFGRKA